MVHKIKWLVQPAPTGQFRSFHHRGWPLAEDENGKTLFMVCCLDDYTPARSRAEQPHARLTLMVADHSCEGHGFQWRKFKRTFHTLAELKEAAPGVLQSLHSKLYPE